MVTCSILNCKNSSVNCSTASNGVTFHHFPRDPKMREKWIAATGKKDWVPSNYNRVCSHHFKSDLFEIKSNRRHLFIHAVPTIDIWQKVEKLPDDPETSKSTALLSKPEPEQKDQPADDQQPSNSSNEPDQSDKNKGNKLYAEVLKNRKIIKQQRTRIKTLQCTMRRYRKKIEQLIDIIHMLENKYGI
ncbi:THAP domain-containing protein 1-like isoform X2 [Anticarsia gemmatalis]